MGHGPMAHLPCRYRSTHRVWANIRRIFGQVKIDLEPPYSHQLTTPVWKTYVLSFSLKFQKMWIFYIWLTFRGYFLNFREIDHMKALPLASSISNPVEKFYHLPPLIMKYNAHWCKITLFCLVTLERETWFKTISKFSHALYYAAEW